MEFTWFASAKYRKLSHGSYLRHAMVMNELRLAPHLTVGDVSCHALADAVFTNRGQLKNLVMGPRIGHAVTKAFAESRSADPAGPFSAVLGAISAATALSNQHYSFQQRRTSAWLSIYMPIVVLQGQLFEYYIDDTGTEVLAECSRAHVLAYPPTSNPFPFWSRSSRHQPCQNLRSLPTQRHDS